MSKFIDADRLRAEIEKRLKNVHDYMNGVGMKYKGPKYYKMQGKESAYDALLSNIDSLQQEQPIKVYRVENEREQKGLWRKFDGTWEPLFDMLTDGQCKDMPMEDNPIYREGGKQWFASAPSKETLQKWFSKRDLEELTAKGFTISEFEVVGHKKISDFEYIFTRDSIISRTYLKVSDIYPQEQPEVDLIEEIKIRCWVARDEDGGLHLFVEVPKRYRRRGIFQVNPGVWSLNEWNETHTLCLDRESFSDLKWKDEPREVELIIRENK